MQVKWKPVLLILCACACLWGCAGKTEERQEQTLDRLAQSFESTANIRYGGLSATAAITRDSPQSCTVAFTSPESLRDMAFVFRQDNVDLSYKGMQFSFAPSSMPGRAVAKTAVSAINATVAGNGLTMDYAGGVLEVEGKTESGIFTLQLDAESGSLLKLSVLDEDLEIEFLNFSFLG